MTIKVSREISARNMKRLECHLESLTCSHNCRGGYRGFRGPDVPDVVLPLAALSEKDRKDLEFACELGVDWLALSFVQRPEDVTEAKDLARGRAAVLSKIEKPVVGHRTRRGYETQFSPPVKHPTLATANLGSYPLRWFAPRVSPSSLP